MLAHPENAPAAPVVEFTSVACMKFPEIDRGAFTLPSPSSYTIVNITSLEDGKENLTMDTACVSKYFMISSIALKA